MIYYNKVYHLLHNQVNCFFKSFILNPFIIINIHILNYNIILCIILIINLINLLNLLFINNF